MSGEWAVGDLAMVRYQHSDTWVVGIRATPSGNWRTQEHGSTFAVADARPLVVIDPEDREQVNRLDVALSKMHFSPASCGSYGVLQSALRSLIAPPKLEEPTGLGAVVEATAYTDKVRHFVRVDSDRAAWTDAEGNGHDWAELDLLNVLSVGVTP